MMRQYIKPLPTTIPKPMTLRTTGRYGKPVMTEEWKEYALSIFPVKPSQHWDIRREDYDLLIPDPELHEAAKDPTGKAKNTLIRSIYDWFRVRHRIAQLKVVLSECDITMDNEELRAAYIEKMKEKKWPIYDRKLKNCEVRAARAQVFESYLDGTASQC
ncbi:unnamed protein product, partial [Anisakis simplex]|uniref:Integrase n=1 Tax=Anisakis simplex TaxID=6269 RepID=A0A0M3JKL3_ANISI